MCLTVLVYFVYSLVWTCSMHKQDKNSFLDKLSECLSSIGLQQQSKIGFAN